MSSGLSISSSGINTIHCQMVGSGATSNCPCPSHLTETITTTQTVAVASILSSDSVVTGSSSDSYASVDTSASTSAKQPSQWASNAVTYSAPYISGGLTAESAPVSATTVYKEQPTAGYTFNASARDNVAVYYGASPATQQGGIIALCENPNVDIVILAFLTDFFAGGGYPAVNFGAACWAATDAQVAAAPDLQDCSNVAWQVQGCQAMGKKVLLALGGASSRSNFSSVTQAEQFASTLWDLFGKPDPMSKTLAIRPFGPQISLDGFDLDSETKNTTGWTALATALRKQFAKDGNKTYYLSAAPQCPIPDASIPLDAMMQCDFVWVQFYNNPGCNIGSNSWLSSLGAWSNQLRNNSNIGTPRLFVGAEAVDLNGGGGSGYVSGPDLISNLTGAKALKLNNFGGVMLWDGSEALANIDGGGKNYLEYAKSAAAM